MFAQADKKELVRPCRPHLHHSVRSAILLLVVRRLQTSQGNSPTTDVVAASMGTRQGKGPCRWCPLSFPPALPIAWLRLSVGSRFDRNRRRSTIGRSSEKSGCTRC